MKPDLTNAFVNGRNCKVPCDKTSVITDHSQITIQMSDIKPKCTDEVFGKVIRVLDPMFCRASCELKRLKHISINE